MRHFLLLPLVMAVSVLYSQSIIVNPAAAPESALTAEQLTVDVLIDGGECSTIENFELTDNTNSSFPNANRSWGYFERGDRKSTRLNSSHVKISYAVFCLKKKKKT